MKFLPPSGLVLLLLVLPLFSAGCSRERPRVFYINSYHQGYGSSDDIMEGLRDTLSNQVQLKIFYLDSKRHPEEGYLRLRTQEAMAAIESFAPDLLIASDDNAVKQVLTPFFKDGPVPAVFCGVNWSCEEYGLPTRNITGMLEVLPLEESLSILREYFPGDRLAILSENTASERKNSDLLDPLYRQLGFQPTYLLVDNFEDWKREFIRANQEADLIYLPTNGAVRNWNDEEAKSFVRREIRKPVFTCDDFMLPFAVLGLTKIAREQGEWAATTALEILGGRSPAEIPLARNIRTRALWNRELAALVGFEPTPELRKRFENADEVQSP